MTNEEQAKIQYYASQKKRTSHVLHLILSIITCGLWLPVWLIIGVSHASSNKKLDDKMRGVAGDKMTPGEALVRLPLELVKVAAAGYLLYLLITFWLSLD